MDQEAAMAGRNIFQQRFLILMIRIHSLSACSKHLSIKTSHLSITLTNSRLSEDEAPKLKRGVWEGHSLNCTCSCLSFPSPFNFRGRGFRTRNKRSLWESTYCLTQTPPSKSASQHRKFNIKIIVMRAALERIKLAPSSSGQRGCSCCLLQREIAQKLFIFYSWASFENGCNK